MTPELSLLLTDLKQEFAIQIAYGNIWHLGTYNCRRKNNTSDGPWSEHAWPNAVDVMLRNWTGRKALGDRVATWARAYGAAEVFWQIQYHFDHVHITANPRKNHDNKQVPPCAGGPPIGDIMTPEQEAKLDAVLAAVSPTSAWAATIGTGSRKQTLSSVLVEARNYAKIAAAAAHVADNTINLSDADLDAIADAVADEQARRLSQ